MKNKTSPPKTKKRSLYLAVVFIAGVIILLIIAVVVRLTILFSHSTFNNHTAYTLEVVEKDNHAIILVFSPDVQTISELKINNSNTNIGKTLSIPIDGMISTGTLFDEYPVTKTLWNLFVQFHMYKTNNINQADVYKLFLFAEGIKPNAITTENLQIPISNQSTMQILSGLVNDHTLFTDGQSIAVVNATSISGRGNQLTKLLTNIGANVVSVSTGDREEKQSIIYYVGKSTYTIRRLQKILHFSVKAQKPPISDIMIIIGTDSNNSSIF